MTDTPLQGAVAPLKPANCLGCGTVVTPGVSHCAVCIERQGQAPPMMFNLAAQKRPPYEKLRESAVNPAE